MTAVSRRKIKKKKKNGRTVSVLGGRRHVSSSCGVVVECTTPLQAALPMNTEARLLPARKCEPHQVKARAGSEHENRKPASRLRGTPL